VIDRWGADYVLYEGLLAEAHRQSLNTIVTLLVQAPANQNGWLAVCASLMESSRGHFTGLGGARLIEAAKLEGRSLVGPAEIRTKAQTLRDAVGAKKLPSMTSTSSTRSVDASSVTPRP
jgi:hypothetical protein